MQARWWRRIPSVSSLLQVCPSKDVITIGSLVVTMPFVWPRMSNHAHRAMIVAARNAQSRTVPWRLRLELSYNVVLELYSFVLHLSHMSCGNVCLRHRFANNDCGICGLYHWRSVEGGVEGSRVGHARSRKGYMLRRSEEAPQVSTCFVQGAGRGGQVERIWRVTIGQVRVWHPRGIWCRCWSCRLQWARPSAVSEVERCSPILSSSVTWFLICPVSHFVLPHPAPCCPALPSSWPACCYAHLKLNYLTSLPALLCSLQSPVLLPCSRPPEWVHHLSEIIGDLLIVQRRNYY